MTLNELLTVVAQVAGLLGIMGSMFGMGLGLTVPQIVTPLKNVRLVVLALLANFVLVPLLAYVISLIIPLDDALKIGLMVLALSAGAPFLILEARGAKANLGLAVGVMTLLMVVTIFFLPLVLPLLLTGVEVDAGAIAKSLIVLMLVPLILGLLVRANAARHRPTLDAGHEQDRQPGHHDPAGGRAGAEHLQRDQPDRQRRVPGAAALHRRQPGDRLAVGRP